MSDVLHWADELLDALQYLHEHKPSIIHRDIKPANLKLTDNGRIVLLDFGLAKGIAGEMTRAGNSLSVYGYTPHYAPLEQIQGEGTSPRSDLYSLGATLYHLLTGHKPFDALKRTAQMLHGEGDPLKPVEWNRLGVPKHVDAVVRRAMSLKQGDRPANAVEMRRQLREKTHTVVRALPLDLDGMLLDVDETMRVANEERKELPLNLGEATRRESPASPFPRSFSEFGLDEATRVNRLMKRATLPKTDYEIRQNLNVSNPARNYEFPSIDLLNTPAPRHEQAEDELRSIGVLLIEALRAFNITGKLEHICPGPVFTTYEFKPDAGVTASRVSKLKDDLSMAARSEVVEIERYTNRPHVGIVVANQERETISMREVIESRAFRDSESKLTLALGKTIDGLNYVADLAKMPHLLIAGATGTGKSVCLNTIITSLLYKATPDELKLVLIDTKHVNFNFYADIPHLATQIITDPKRAANALKWAVSQARASYLKLSQFGVSSIDSYNAEVLRRNMAKDFDDAGNAWKPLPYLVIIIDELADLMGFEFVGEDLLQITQKGRAVGIHLVVATQRPSSEVLSGEIKAGFRSRIGFQATSRADSRMILDTNGAEQLLGRGDMLFLPSGASRLVRVHGTYLDEAEVMRIVGHVKAQGAVAVDEVAAAIESECYREEHDELFEQALRICVEMKRASTSVLQRRLRIGYGRAAAILAQLERDGMIGPIDGARPSPVLGRAFETVAHWESAEAVE